MTDKIRLQEMFCNEKKTLEEIGENLEITRERVRQLLNRLLGKQEYQRQLLENRLSRPHKMISFIRDCKICGKEFKGRELIDNPRLMCKHCLREYKRKLRTKIYICQNCGVEKEYLDYNRKPVFCSKKCQGQWLYKLKASKSIQ